MFNLIITTFAHIGMIAGFLWLIHEFYLIWERRK